MPIEQRCAGVGAGVEGTNWADHRRYAGKIKAEAQRCEVNLGCVLGGRGTHIGQQMTEFLPLRATRCKRTVAGKQQPKVASQRALNRILE